MRAARNKPLPTEQELVEELVELLRRESSDRAAAERIIAAVLRGEVRSEITYRCYRDAVSLVYFGGESDGCPFGN